MNLVALQLVYLRLSFSTLTEIHPESHVSKLLLIKSIDHSSSLAPTFLQQTTVKATVAEGLLAEAKGSAW